MASTSPEPLPITYNYPFATSPDILRTHQKDAYMTSTISAQLNNLIRELLGARFAHRHSTTTNHISELLYLALTTFLGNRTLGEEYCDVIQVEDDTGRLASLARRTGYIASVVFSPWILSKTLPALRRRLRQKLERNIERAKHQQRQQNSQSPTSSPSTGLVLQEYLLARLDSVTSLSPIYALSLAAFYFTGAYYHLSKRLWGLRYIFTKQIRPNERREGYEVLGVLLVLQMAVQSVLHVRDTFFSDTSSPSSPSHAHPHPMTASSSSQAQVQSQPTMTAVQVGPGVELPVTLPSSSSSPPPNHDDEDEANTAAKLTPGLSANTATPVLDESSPRYDVSEERTMAWIPSGTQRKCTLCLSPFRDPSATTCGHVFCWTCVQDWVKEKAECPLCRQTVLGSKILPLRQ